MQHTINYPEADKLTITATPTEIEELRKLKEENPADWGNCGWEAEALETLIANSELQWIDPSDTGGLTDAPILGILGEEQTEESGPYGCVHTGGGPNGVCLFQPILERWGYPNYQVRSFLDDIIETGKTVFINQW